MFGFSLVETERLDRIEDLLAKLKTKVNILMATADEANAKLDQISSDVAKVGTETDKLLQMVADLQTAAQGQVPDAVMAKINAVADQVKIVDEKVPDVAAPEA